MRNRPSDDSHCRDEQVVLYATSGDPLGTHTHTHLFIHTNVHEPLTQALTGMCRSIEQTMTALLRKAFHHTHSLLKECTQVQYAHTLNIHMHTRTDSIH